MALSISAEEQLICCEPFAVHSVSASNDVVTKFIILPWDIFIKGVYHYSLFLLVHTGSL